jgi:hypothetical protein
MSDLLEPEHNSDSSQRRELVAAKEALAQEKHEQQRSEQEKLDRELLAQQERHQREEAEARIAASSGAVLLPSEILNEATRKVRLTMALVSLFYTGVLILLVVASIVLLAPNLIKFLDHNSPIVINTGRILVSLIAIVFGAGAIAVALAHRRINESMAVAEGQIDTIRDHALIQMQATRYNLDELNEKLSFPKEQHAAGPLEYIELAKKIGPLFSLLMAKERSIVTLGVEGLKFYQSLKKILNK